MSPLAYLAPSFWVLPTGRRPFPEQRADSEGFDWL